MSGARERAVRRCVRRLAAGVALAVAVAPAALAPDVAGAQARPPAVVAGARQLVLVTAGGWDETTAELRRYERAAPNAPWRAVGGATPVVLGRTGLAWGAGQGTAPNGAGAKREGDGRSPAGAFPLIAAFGYGSAHGLPGPRLPFRPVGDGTVCVDDPRSPLYNAVVDSADAGGARWASAERMRAVAGYRVGVVVGYNGARAQAGAVRVTTAGARAVPGRGSCIFLHVWDGPAEPTAGCTAMDEAAMRLVAGWLDPARRPVLVQLTRAELARRRSAWRLPAPNA